MYHWIAGQLSGEQALEFHSLCHNNHLACKQLEPEHIQHDFNVVLQAVQLYSPLGTSRLHVTQVFLGAWHLECYGRVSPEL